MKLFLFFLIPFVIVLKISFAEYASAIPPYTDLMQWGEDAMLSIKLNLGNFQFLLEDDLYWSAYLNSARIALISTILRSSSSSPHTYFLAKECMSRSLTSRRRMCRSRLLFLDWTLTTSLSSTVTIKNIGNVF